MCTLAGRRRAVRELTWRPALLLSLLLPLPHPPRYSSSALDSLPEEDVNSLNTLRVQLQGLVSNCATDASALKEEEEETAAAPDSAPASAQKAPATTPAKSRAVSPAAYGSPMPRAQFQMMNSPLHTPLQRRGRPSNGAGTPMVGCKPWDG